MKVQSMGVLQDDRILLTKLGFFGFHGVMPEENTLGQRFFIDLTCGVDLSEPGRTDSLEKTVSYADIYSVAKEAFEQKRFKLIEALAQHIVNFLFAAFPAIDWIRIAVRKPSAPIAMVSGEAAIEITRSRGDA
ncbi:MAG: dihydroneopterin aldolase [Devosia sp.]|nr:dihydroneopterin aldolase [Devosia sp.]